MDNLRGLLGIRRMERIDGGMLWWFTHVERMERGMIAKRVYVQEFAGSCSAGRQWKRWLDTVKECLKKRGLNIRQTRRMVHDRSECQGFVRGNAWGIA